MVPLNVRSAYNLLESPLMVSKLVSAAKGLGYQAIGLADQTVLYGMAELFQSAQQLDLKPILGLTAPTAGILNQASQFDMQLYPENNTGYQHLLKLSSLLATGQANLNLKVLQQQDLLDGLMLVLPPRSELSLILQNNADLQSGLQYLQLLLDIIPAQQVWLGIDLQMSEALLTQYQQLAQTYHLSLLAFDEISYLKPQDYFLQRVLGHIKAGTPLTNLGSVQSEGGANYLRTPNLWETAYDERGVLNAAQATDAFAARIDVQVPKRVVDLPDITPANFASSAEYLENLATQGLQNRLASQNLDQPVYQQRLAYELQVINDLGFDQYFLIVWDVINFAHAQHILTGPGRGSAAGSLVAYSLMITDVDPIAEDLLFERFLNPERAQMPDIDIDIPDNQRETILNYLHEKYGHNQMAQIITFSTLGMKQSLRDVARVFGLQPIAIDTLAKALPRDTQNLEMAFQSNQRFQNAVLDLPVDGKLLLHTAQALAGLPRNQSLHAAGVVLAAQPLVELVPMQLGDDGRLVTQLTKNPVETFGLLKIDFLALSNLNLLTIALNEIQKHESFVLADIDVNDVQTLKLFQAGQTNGVFQFESGGMKNLLVQLQPDRFEDLVAANALYRPGPMENIPTFIARKHGQENIPVVDPKIDLILAPTYGVIVYQEQVMRVAEQYAGFSLAEADLLRRAISKKKQQQMAELKTIFIERAQAQGHALSEAQAVYQYIEKFGAYGFNRSHAVAYSKLAMQLAYIKVHYPLAFYKGVLNLELGNQTKVRGYVEELRAQRLQLLGPNINQSFAGYSIYQQQLQMGLASISGLQRDLRQAILEERRANGIFADLGDFIWRLGAQYKKAEIYEPLIEAGALDELNSNRRVVMQSLPKYLESRQLAGQSHHLYEVYQPLIRTSEDYPANERLAHEYQRLGIYLSGHPIEAAMQQVSKDQYQTIQEAIDRGSGLVRLLVMIENIKQIRTKKGEQMAFLDVMDLTGQISLTLFPKQYQQYQNDLKTQGFVLVNGKLEAPNERSRHWQVTVNQLQPIQATASQPLPPATGTWFVQLANWPLAVEHQAAWQQLLQPYRGQNPVVIVSEDRKYKWKLPLTEALKDDPAIGEILRTQLQALQVKFVVGR
ncbi:DNA polymerase III subunit alpha [Weissella kandleri]